MKKAILFLVIIFFLPSLQVDASSEEIIFSEIMYDLPGGDSGKEWVEFFNSGEDSIEILTGAGGNAWRFFDGSNHIINLYQGTTTLGPGEYFLLASDAENFAQNHPEITVSIFDTVMSLKNSTSSLALSFDGGETYAVETIYNSDWGANGNGFSLERGAESWYESSVEGGTPGQANSEPASIDEPEEEENIIEDFVDEIEPEEEENIAGDQSNSHANQKWQDIIISELLPNPVGSDDGEWIELYNKGTKSLDLIGFSLQDNSARIFTFQDNDNNDYIIEAGSYMVLKKELSKISLNNTGGDSVKLYNPNSDLVDSISYEDVALEGKSFARQGDAFAWTPEPSPGANNIFVDNQAPVASIKILSEKLLVGEKIILSAEDSYDPEEAKLKYEWDFGDEKYADEPKESHVYESAGKYLIKLKVTDNEGLSDESTLLLKIEDKETKISLPEIAPINFDLDDLIISEFIPNPIGSDDGEWIEIFNNSEQEINLLGWQLDDQDGGSKPFVISEDILIKAKGFWLFKREDTKITLNNTSDSVRILTPLAEVWQEIIYEKIPEGKSQSWDKENKEWEITEPSPGGENFFEMYQVGKEEKILSVWECKESEKKDKVTVQGVLLFEPDKKSTSIYLLDWDGQAVDYENLIEIYSHYKDFPKMEAGQVFTVSGEISRTGNLPRLKVKNQEQIIANDIKIELSEPGIIEVDDIFDEHYGTWQKIRGIVVKKSGRNIYLSDEAGGESLLRIYYKFSKKLDIKKGQEIIASGLVSETDNLAKLTVFLTENVLVSQEVLGEKVEDEEIEELINTSTEIIVDEKNQSNNAFWFVLVGVTLVALIFFINKKYLSKNN